MSELKDCFKFSGISFQFILGLFTLCVGISEAVFVAKYDQYDNECRNIWSWILAACCINIVMPCMTACGLYQMLDKKKQGHLPLLHSLLGVGQFIISVWSAVTYFNINTMCHDFWVSKALELWIFVMIHFVALWVNIVFTIVYVIVIFIVTCVAVQGAKNSESAPTPEQVALTMMGKV